MWYEAELVVKSYKPLELEIGMYFLQILHKNTVKEQAELFVLDKIPLNQEEFLQRHGYPVELYIIDESGNVIASPEQIGWWDEGEHSDELSDITVAQINIIFNDYDGYVDVEMEESEENEDEYLPVLYSDKVTLRYVTDDEEEEEEEFDN